MARDELIRFISQRKGSFTRSGGGPFHRRRKRPLSLEGAHRIRTLAASAALALLGAGDGGGGGHARGPGGGMLAGQLWVGGGVLSEGILVRLEIAPPTASSTTTTTLPTITTSSVAPAAGEVVSLFHQIWLGGAPDSPNGHIFFGSLQPIPIITSISKNIHRKKRLGCVAVNQKFCGYLGH